MSESPTEMSEPPRKFVVDTTDEQFKTDVLVRSAELPVVVDFWAEWCQPCRLLGPVLEQLAEQYQGRFLLVKAEMERNQAIAAGLGVQAIPAILAFRDGKLVDQVVGLLDEANLRKWIDQLMPSEAELNVREAAGLEATDLSAAEAGYRKALALDENDPLAKIGLARVLLKQQRVAESRELVEQLAARGFLEPEAEKLQAELDLQAAGQEVPTSAECRAAVEQAPDDLDARWRLAEALSAEGEYAETLDICLGLVQSGQQALREPARKMMVDIFQILEPDSDLATTYRRKLSAALY